MRGSYKLMVDVKLFFYLSLVLCSKQLKQHLFSFLILILFAVLNLLPLATRKYQWLIQLQNELTWLTDRHDGAIPSDWAVAKKFLHKTDSTVGISSYVNITPPYWLQDSFKDELLLSDSAKRAGLSCVTWWQPASLCVWFPAFSSFQMKP